jgi:hypothetical protein
MRATADLDGLLAVFAPDRDEHADPVPDVDTRFGSPSAAAPASASESPQTAAEGDGEHRPVDQALWVFREPIEWVLAHAEQRAWPEPIDRAAVHRVRDAVRIRMASSISGVLTSAAAPRIRATDLLIIARLLARGIDPGIVRDMVRDVVERFTSALGMLFVLDPSLACALAQIAASFAPCAPIACTPPIPGAPSAPNAAVALRLAMYGAGDERQNTHLPLGPTSPSSNLFDCGRGTPHPAMPTCRTCDGRLI